MYDYHVTKMPQHYLHDFMTADQRFDVSLQALQEAIDDMKRKQIVVRRSVRRLSKQIMKDAPC